MVLFKLCVLHQSNNRTKGTKASDDSTLTWDPNQHKSPILLSVRRKVCDQDFLPYGSVHLRSRRVRSRGLVYSCVLIKEKILPFLRYIILKFQVSRLVYGF